MIKTIATAALIAGASLTFAGVAQAEDFPATPMNKGAPNNIPGMSVIPGGNLAIGAVGQGLNLVGDVTAGPVAAVNAAVGGPAPAPAAEESMMRRHRMAHHHMHHKMMMKKMMMKKKEM